MPVYDVCLNRDRERYVIVPADSPEDAVQQAAKLLHDFGTDLDLSVFRERASHETVGRTFRAPLADGGICRCIAWDWRTGFWMQFANGELRDVSERAIGRTFHRIYTHEE